MELRVIPIHEIHPAAYNPRKRLKPGDPAYDRLKKAIDEFGMVEPLVWNERTGNLVGGHQRLTILTERGESHVEVSVVSLDGQQEKVLNLALNKHGGEWDDDGLRSLLSGLELGVAELAGFSEKEFEELINPTSSVSPWEAVDVSAGPGEIKQLVDDVVFSSNNFYGIPDLRVDRLGESRPTETFRRNCHGSPAGKLLIFGGDVPDSYEGSIIAFFGDDRRFESIWRDAPGTGRKFLDLGIKECIAPDFSVWKDDPRAVQIWNVYRSRWCARYWQELGLTVIPNLQWSDTESLDYTLAGIPRHVPVAAMQVRTVKAPDEIKACREGVQEVLRLVEVDCLLVYCESKRFDALADLWPTGARRVTTFTESMRRRNLK